MLWVHIASVGYQWKAAQNDLLHAQWILSRQREFLRSPASLCAVCIYIYIRSFSKFCLAPKFWHFSVESKTWSRSDKNSRRVVEPRGARRGDGWRGEEEGAVCGWTRGEIKFLAERGRSHLRGGEVKRRSPILAWSLKAATKLGRCTWECSFMRHRTPFILLPKPRY